MKIFSDTGNILIIFLMTFLLFLFLYFFSADLGIKKYSFALALLAVVFCLYAYSRHFSRMKKRHAEELENLRSTQPWEREGEKKG